MAVHIVTQFCFDGASMLNWIARLRDFGIEHPVRIGLAGPTNLSTLCCAMRSAAACARPPRGWRGRPAWCASSSRMSAPDGLLRALAEARADLGDVAPHFFSFGGLARTARWAQAVAERPIAIEGGEGFRVEPPR